VSAFRASKDGRKEVKEGRKGRNGVEGGRKEESERRKGRKKGSGGRKEGRKETKEGGSEGSE